MANDDRGTGEGKGAGSDSIGHLVIPPYGGSMCSYRMFYSLVIWGTMFSKFTYKM